MERLDLYSYTCGHIDCANEMIAAGVKTLAFSRPLDPQVRDAAAEYAKDSCQRWNTRLYREDAPLVTDLFPVSACRDRCLLLLYRESHILDQYIRLKERKESLQAEGAYFGGNRTQIAWELGRLLSYPEEEIRRRIRENEERE